MEIRMKVKKWTLPPEHMKEEKKFQNCSNGNNLELQQIAACTSIETLRRQLQYNSSQQVYWSWSPQVIKKILIDASHNIFKAILQITEQILS